MERLWRKPTSLIRALRRLAGKIMPAVRKTKASSSPARNFPVAHHQVSLLNLGHQVILGGTSAVALLWAALITLIKQQLGHPAGYLNPLLYSGQIAIAGHFTISPVATIALIRRVGVGRQQTSRGRCCAWPSDSRV